MITTKVGYKPFRGATRNQYENALELFNKSFNSIDTTLELNYETKMQIVDLFYACKERCKSYVGIGGCSWLATAVEDLSLTELKLQEIIVKVESENVN